MKSILLHIGDDPLLESRLQAALDLTRYVNGHLECLQTRRIPAFLGADAAGFAGSASMMMQLVEDESRHAEEESKRLSARLDREGITYSWAEGLGDPAQTLTDRSLLADCIVMSIGDVDAPELERILPAVATRADAPVLAMPPKQIGLPVGGPVLIAWKPTSEAARAVKAALPLLQRASRVDIVTVGDQGMGDFPPTAVAVYLARHGISCELHQRVNSGQSTSDVLLGTALELGSSMLVMGSYGRSRAMEFLLGGVTRRLLSVSNLPLFMVH